MLDGFLNQDGFVTVQPNSPAVPGEGNGLLVTGLAMACGMYFNPQARQMLARCQFSPNDPRVWRSPHKTNPGDETQVDDYWGAVHLSFDWSRDLLAFVEKNGMNFDPFGKRFKYWFGRFVALKPFFRLAVGKDTFFDRLILFFTILVDAMFINSASGNMKAFCRIHFAIDHTAPLTLASRFWLKRIKNKYGSVGKSWAEYFGEGHPLNDYDE